MWLAPKSPPVEGRDLLGHLPCSSLLQATRSYSPFHNLLFEGINQILDSLLSAGHTSNWKESYMWSFQTAKSLWWQMPARTGNHHLLEMKVDEVVWQILWIEFHTPQKESGSILLTNILTEERQHQHRKARKGPLGDRRTMAQKTWMPVSTQFPQRCSVGLKTTEWQWSSRTGSKLSYAVHIVQ